MCPYVVLRCNNKHCGKFTYCKSSQKTKQCPYCNKRINVLKRREVTVETNEQARAVVQAYNQAWGEHLEPEWYKEIKKEAESE